MPKVILFNGPPDSGKDTCVKFLLKKHEEIFFRLRMANSLKEGLHRMLGLYSHEEEYADCKGVPHPDFFNRIPRECYITAAERFMKVMFGVEVFGHIWLRQYEMADGAARAFFDSAQKQIALVPDCGFGPEIQPLINHFGADQIWLFRLYKKGCDFSQDSRGYVQGILPFEREIVNIDGQPEKMLRQLEYMLTVNGLYTEFYGLGD